MPTAKDEITLNVTDLKGKVHAMSVPNAFDAVQLLGWKTSSNSPVQPIFKPATDDVVKAAKEAAKEAAKAPADEAADAAKVAEDEATENEGLSPDVVEIKKAAGSKPSEAPAVAQTEKVVKKAEAQIPVANTGKGKDKK